MTDVRSSSRFRQTSGKPPPFRVRVYNDRLFESIIEDGKQSFLSGSCEQSVKSKHSRRTQPNSSLGLQVSESSTEAKAAKRQRREEQYHLQRAQQKHIQDNFVRELLHQAATRKEKEFVHLTGEVAAGHLFVEELEQDFGIDEEVERRRKLKQFQDWDFNVHGAIQRRIDEILASMCATEINERRRRDLEKFLVATNSKAAIFRDIIIESEYDPLEPNRNAIKVRVSRLRNPCRRVLDKRAEENCMMSGESLSKTKPFLRETLDVKLWEDRRVKDTPHGFFAKIMDRETTKKGTKKVSRTFLTTFKFDDYNFERGRDVVTKEFPDGKKTFPGHSTSSLPLFPAKANTSSSTE
ncbi:unnamed protein product [Ascophyllum nodosum]